MILFRAGRRYAYILTALLLFQSSTLGARADLLFPMYLSRNSAKKLLLLKLLGYTPSRQEPFIQQPSEELQKIFDDLKAGKAWPTRKEALLKLGMGRLLSESFLVRFFKRPYDLGPDVVLAGNFDDDPATEYVVFFSFDIGAFPPRLIYIDETLAKRKPVIYEFAYMYWWYFLIRDVNGDGVQDFILRARQQIGTGMGYGYLLIFNLVDGELTPLFRLTIECYTSRMVADDLTFEDLREKFLASSITPGHLDDFVVHRRYRKSRKLEERYFGNDWYGGWSIGVNEKLRYKWNQKMGRYSVRRFERTITATRDPRSKDSMQYPGKEYEALEKDCAERGKRSYRRVP